MSSRPRIIEIDNGRAFSHHGNYTAFLESKAVRNLSAKQSERRRQRFLRTELECVRAGVKATVKNVFFRKPGISGMVHAFQRLE